MAGSSRYEVDFFISYCSTDQLWAEWIAWQLEAFGYSTRLQAWDFVAGSDFIHEMQQAVTSAERTIAVLSPAYGSSIFGEAEWRAAFAQDPSGEKRLLVPVLVQECEPPGLLASRVWINLIGADERTAKTRLLDGLRERGARPSQSPRFPGSGPGSIAEVWRFPGELPPTWSVPHPHHPSFTGREELLTTLHQGFAHAHGATCCQVLAGLGGTGKTQLAVEYTYRHQADYELIWWVRAEDRATLIGDFTALGAEVGLPPQSDQDVAVDAVRDWLKRQRQQRWLLVLDGAEGPHILRELVPRGGIGHVLVTSRRDVDWDGVANQISVEVLPLADATRLLLARTGESDQVAAEELAIVLGCLPLALEQAGALIAQTGVITLARYLELFRRRSRELLAQGQPMGTAHTVATTWNLSLEELQQQSPAAVELLNVAAFLAPEDLPWHPLVDHAEMLPPVLAQAAGDVLKLGKAVVALRFYSLAKVAGDGLIIHRLLQTVVRERLDEESQRDWGTVAVRLLERSFPQEPGEPSSWPVCQRLLPHALQVMEYAERLGIEPQCGAKILDRSVEYLMARGQLHQARAVTEWLLPLAERASRPPGSATAAIRRSLGRVLRDLGKPAEARDQLEHALAIDQAVLGSEDARVADDHCHLGRVLRELGKLDEARVQLEQALRIDLAIFGPEHRWVAEEHRSLGRVLQNLGDLPAAREQMEQALAINEALFGPDHWRPAYDRCQLGTVLRDLGELAQAQAQLERALEIDERTFGPDHWRVAQDRRYLGTILRHLGKLAQAQAQLELALEIDKTVYDPADWRVAQDRRYLGTVLREQGELAEAQAQLEQALEIDEATYGANHWRVAQDLRHLGRVFTDLGDLPAARTQLQRALEIDEATYGHKDWRIAEDHRFYSKVLRDLGELAEARGLLERALTIDERALGPDHWRVAQDHRYLAHVLAELDEHERAQEHLEFALVIIERLQDLHHPVLSAIRGDLEALRHDLRLS